MQTLDYLWAIIGENGSRLTPSEKAQIIQILSIAGNPKPGMKYTLSYAFTRHLSSCMKLEEYKDIKAAPGECWKRTFNFTLSPFACWEAISRIALAQSCTLLVPF